jgi:poly(3-hydroxybutyrate) depolymerase
MGPPPCSTGGDGDGPGMHDIEIEPSHYFAYVPDAYDPDEPMRALVSLHGDEGDPEMSVVYIWGQGHWMAHQDYILIMPQVAYSPPNWYGNETEPEGQELNGRWLDRVIADAGTRWNLDLKRLYMVGLSGGAWFQSIYMMTRQDRIAAIAFTLGGAGPADWFYQDAPTEACRIPARFTEGTEDFLYKPSRQLYDYLTERGHETEWVDLEGVGHDFTTPPTEQVDNNFDWMMERTLCQDTVCPTPLPAPDGGVGPETGEAH